MAISHAVKGRRIVDAVVRDAEGKFLGLIADVAIREFAANTDPAKIPIAKNGGRPPKEPRPAGPAAPTAAGHEAARRDHGPPPNQGSGGRRPPPAAAVTVGEDGRPKNAAESFAEFRAEKEQYAAALAKLEYEKAVGLVVDATEVGKVWVQLVTEAKTRMLSLPSQAKAQIPHLTKGDVRLIEDLVRQALEGLAKWQPPQA